MKVYCPLMPAPFDNIVQHIFHQPSLQSVTVDELKRMTQRHPAFAAAHFLLLRKMQDSRHSGFEQQLQKTALYFNNPLWLQYLLSPDQVQEPEVLDHPPFIESEVKAPDEPVTASSNAAMTIEDTASLDFVEAKVESAPADLNHTDEPVIVTPEPIKENGEAAEVNDPPDAPEKATANLPQPLMEAGQPEYQSAINIAEEVFDSAPEEKTEAMPTANGDPGDPDATEPESPDDRQELPITDKPLLRTILEVPAAKDDLLFEPYHTVDYFASQGIGLSKTDAAEPKDQFAKQLRSFTEWLKTMKRLPQASIDKMLAEKEDSRVTADAVHSLETKEVITEAMAEVFEKQGLAEKAADVYRKLSLQNPSKSTYFAAKIEALKL